MLAIEEVICQNISYLGEHTVSIPLTTEAQKRASIKEDKVWLKRRYKMFYGFHS
jgi:hypothetical protein